MESSVPPAALARDQKVVVAILSFVEFTILLDWMIISPLGAILLRDLHLPTAKFGLLVSLYALGAATGGFLAAGFADRFDRKRMLTFFYAGFIGAAGLSAVAPTYEILLAARVIAGIFGGVTGSVILAILADLFPFARGRVVAFVVQGSFAACQVLGVPLGLALANHWGWHAPFVLILALGASAWVLARKTLRPIDAHLRLQHAATAFAHLIGTIADRRYTLAFATIALFSMGAFMLMPFGSTFMVNNVGIPFGRLPIVYLCTGTCALLASPLVGRLCDRSSKYLVFCLATALTVIMTFIYTHLGHTALPWLILVSVLMFLGITSRIISAFAIILGVPAPSSRGAFMALNASLQQAAGGVGAIGAGLIVSRPTGGALMHFDVLGNIVIATMLAVVIILRPIDRRVRTQLS
jgi:predicted MFS family arabinose efflux permease